MDAGKKVWAPHFDEGFILGEICDFGTDTLSVQPLDGSKVSAPKKNLSIPPWAQRPGQPPGCCLFT
jgi:hypothetical protein